MTTPNSLSEVTARSFCVQLPWIATSVDSVAWVAPFACRVVGITARVTIQASSGPTTAVVKKAPSATGIASGTAVQAGTIDLAGTNDTNQTIGLATTTANLAIAAGDALGLDFTGTMTAATGCATVWLAPV